MEIECRKNIKKLHVFIESWLKGSIEKSKLEFQYFKDVLDEDFVIIHPSGERQTKPDVARDLWEAHGVQPESFIIEIREIRIRSVAENICIMDYQERQTGTEKSVRISTVVFRKSAKDNKSYWLHLHETWCLGK